MAVVDPEEAVVGCKVATEPFLGGEGVVGVGAP